jgi:uncharacterized SAM-binding protein YcdF (DUF218 family)
VLTGKEERMHVGFALLRAGLGGKLLISGVVQGANPLELARVRAADPALYDSAVELDEAAVTTADNARIAAAWAAAHGFRRLIVVSSAWHLPRGLVLLADAAPEVMLQPAPAPAPWPWLGLPVEWAKFIWARGRTPG